MKQKVKLSNRYLKLAKSKLIDMEVSDPNEIDTSELGKIAFNIGKIKEFQDVVNYTNLDIVSLLLETIDCQLV